MGVDIVIHYKWSHDIERCMQMEYIEYKGIAIRYITCNYGSLDVIKVHNKSIEENIRGYMYKQVAENNISGDAREIIKENTSYWTRFI